jgi:hypothetical protein
LFISGILKSLTCSSHQQQIKKKEGVVRLPDTISVKELAEKTGIQVPQLVATLMRNGIRATITQSIDFDTAAIIASELGVTVQREERSAKAEDLHTRNLEELLKDDPENLVTRTAHVPEFDPAMPPVEATTPFTKTGSCKGRLGLDGWTKLPPPRACPRNIIK